CSNERETPRRKAVASHKAAAAVVATSVKLHGARPWHLAKMWVMTRLTPRSISRAKPIAQVGTLLQSAFHFWSAS
ncbi:MAG: hypothetical protein ACREEM_20755, partial [Blastocatellia bacterium]